MKRNVGTADRIVRIVIGLAIIGAGIVYGSWWGAIGIVPLATGLVGYCGLYSVFGMSTCPVERSRDTSET